MDFLCDPDLVGVPNCCLFALQTTRVSGLAFLGRAPNMNLVSFFISDTVSDSTVCLFSPSPLCAHRMRAHKGSDMSTECAALHKQHKWFKPQRVNQARKIISRFIGCKSSGNAGETPMRPIKGKIRSVECATKRAVHLQYWAAAPTNTCNGRQYRQDVQLTFQCW